MRRTIDEQPQQGRRLVAASLPLLVLVALLFLAGGCGPDQQRIQAAVSDYYAGAYPAAEQLLRDPARKPDQDFVLNNLRLGSVTLADYNLDESENAFLRAIEVINSTGVNNGGRTLGAVLVDEKIKIWKGEPFERAMGSFYLGLIYYMRQDYQNARASFQNALFKLNDYNPDDPKQSHEMESNFALARLMLAKSYQRIGRDDLATANFDRVRQNDPQLTALTDEKMNAASNLLLVVDYGQGPRKIANDDGAVIGFAPRPDEVGIIPPPRVLVDGAVASSRAIAVAPDDLLAMAQERRWQSIDTIRAVKSAVGTGLLIGGGITGVQGLHSRGARQRTDLMVSGALIGAGLLLKATSQADIRQWEMLPRTTFILPVQASPGTHDISVDFPNGVHQMWRNIPVPEKGEVTYYIRIQRWNSGPFDWPPPTMHNDMKQPEE